MFDKEEPVDTIRTTDDPHEDVELQDTAKSSGGTHKGPSGESDGSFVRVREIT